ncbi:hypothetical protein PR002_g17238 [Phytophthora rubi]|uniref:Uncharacterized protein n=1 Tax=Phytophthora rubi TaxID=129364 RepID=A0A6A3K9K2_9STRA|nr:hypothetical protein PR002_g17238 [Phytophthora rubi]
MMLDERNRLLRFLPLLSSNSVNKFAILLDQVVGVSTLDPTFRRYSRTSSS